MSETNATTSPSTEHITTEIQQDCITATAEAAQLRIDADVLGRHTDAALDGLLESIQAVVVTHDAHGIALTVDGGTIEFRPSVDTDLRDHSMTEVDALVEALADAVRDVYWFQHLGADAPDHLEGSA